MRLAARIVRTASAFPLGLGGGPGRPRGVTGRVPPVLYRAIAAEQLSSVPSRMLSTSVSTPSFSAAVPP